MEALMLARLQFALTIAFHYIFPPLSIGLGLITTEIDIANDWVSRNRIVENNCSRAWPDRPSRCGPGSI